MCVCVCVPFVTSQWADLKNRALQCRLCVGKQEDAKVKSQTFSLLLRGSLATLRLSSHLPA